MRAVSRAPLNMLLAVMPRMRQHFRYVPGITWLPTYLSIALIALSKIENSDVAMVIGILGIIVCGSILELMYRIALGDERLLLRNQLSAFALQIVAWGAAWAWHAQVASST